MKLFLTAFHEETQAVLKYFKDPQKMDKRLHTCEYNNTTWVSLEVGIGFQNSKYSLEKYLAKQEKQIEEIFIVGFCGALDPSLEIGQIVMPQIVETEDGRNFSLSIQHQKEPINLVNKILSVDKIIRTSQQKKELFHKTHCQIVDMESAPIVGLASAKNIPVSIVKSVLDSGEQEIPQNIRQPLEEEKNLLIELKNNLKMAKERLEKDFLEKFICPS